MKSKLFKRINEEKINSTLSKLNYKKEKLISFIPLLLHINILYPPFNINSNAPCGIYEYIPNQPLVNDFENFFKIKISKKQLRPQINQILTVASIGSFGTISYKKDSDIDYWIILKEDSDRTLLEEKCKKIENLFWEEYQLEVHFFVMFQKEIYENNFGTINSESAGSSLGILLKEEFYRTATYFAGKIPSWFIDQDEVKRDPEHFINLGEITEIPKEEIYGAALWHILKSTSSPLKSLIKMALIKIYLNRNTNFKFLAEEIKEVQVKEQRYIDPYLFLYNKILLYYKEKVSNLPHLDSIDLLTQKNRKEKEYYIVSIASYLNVAQTERENQKVMECITHSPLTTHLINELKGFETWSLDEYKKLTKEITMQIFDIYKQLRSKISTISSKITQNDLTIIGRKLEAKLLPKKEKILHFTTIPISSTNKMFIIIENTNGFSLYKDSVREENLLFRSQTLIGILAWLHLNKFPIKKIQLSIQTLSFTITKKTIEFLYEKISTFLNEKFEANANDFLFQPYIKSLLIFPNFFIARKNSSEIMEMDILFINSWEEIFAKRLSSKSVEIIFSELIPLFKKEFDLSIEYLKGYRYNPFLQTFLNELFSDIKALLHKRDEKNVLYYIFQYMDNFFILRFFDSKNGVIKKSSEIEVLSFILTQDIDAPKIIKINNDINNFSTFKKIFSLSELNKIDIFIAESNNTTLFLTDEYNNLFVRKCNNNEIINLLNKLNVLIKNNNKKINKIIRIINSAEIEPINMTNKYEYLLSHEDDSGIKLSIKETETGYKINFKNISQELPKNEIYKLTKYFSNMEKIIISEIQFKNPNIPFIKYIQTAKKILKLLGREF